MVAFRVNMIVRISVLAATLLLAVWLFVATEFFAVASLVAASSVFQLFWLFRHVDRTNRELAAFIASVAEGDFANLSVTEPGGDSFQSLRASFTDLANKFSLLRSEREAQAKYLDAVTRHIPVPLIAIGQEGNVTLLNNAARRLLGIQELSNIRNFAGFGQDFSEQIQNLGAGRDIIVDVTTPLGPRKLSVRKTLITVEGGTETLISLNDINRALDAAEVEAWRKLTQVLTHEIMNSVTPITSMSETMLSMLKSREGVVDGQEFEDALEIVAERSRGLLKFVQRYREVTRVPVPSRQHLSIEALFASVARLCAEDAKNQTTEIAEKVEPSSLSVYADPELLTQCLLNLVNNALDAVANRDDGKVTLAAHLDVGGRSTISVTDNGCGIPSDQLESIFIPFYTTKPEGSGIGLSLTRLIVQAHGGTLSVRSEPGEGTTMSLTV